MGKGLYSLPEVAQLVGTSTQKVRTWMIGRSGHDPLLGVDYEHSERQYHASFLDLIDVLIVHTLRERKFSLQLIRKIHERLSRKTGAHPFSRHEVVTLGEKILLRLFETEEGVSDDAELIDVVRNQHYFSKGLEPVLERIDYHGGTGYAERWRIAKGVVIDPACAFGKPVVAEKGIATWVLANASDANNGDIEAVADFYGVFPRHVTDAVRFERRLRAA